MSKATVFISYSSKDKDWVKNWFLPRFENNGFQAHIDYRDFEIGIPSILNMERAVEKCAKTILILTPNWCESNWTQFEGIMLQTEDPMNLNKKIIPLMLDDCTLPRRLIIFTYADFREKDEWDTQLTRLKKQIKKDFDELIVEKPSYPPVPEENIEIMRLPQTGYELFGRRNELAMLNDAWESDATNMVAYVAYGGTGKSTLINKWLEKMRWDNYRGARRIFAWSFYSQGTGERVTSADLFIKEALAWFGDDDPAQGSPWDKGKRLAQLIRRDKTLLILDGMEPLQSYHDFEKGKIKDPALAVLVAELAKNNNGLCIITTREDIPDIHRFSPAAQQVNLEQISDEAGRALLRVRGIRGADAELEQVTRAFGNHALAINLLAEYLHLLPEHPADKANDIPDLPDIPEKSGKHPRRVIEAFAEYLGEGAELELLHILGLFDRPADKAAIDAVVQAEPIPGLTEHLHPLSEGQWYKLLEKLRDIKLIAPESHHRAGTIDCHPLIREHFIDKLQTNNKPAWIEANSRLYEYYKNLPEKELPDTLEEMEPLFMAIAHACRAGKFNKADHLYLESVLRRNQQHFFHKFGAFGTHLSILSNFFELPWKKVAREIDDNIAIWLLNTAGVCLRALGRLREAVQPLHTALEMYRKSPTLGDASTVSINLSELYLTLGEVEKAVNFGKQTMEFPNRSRHILEPIKKLACMANALLSKGDIEDSKNYFFNAEKIQKKAENGTKLYSLRGYHFCDLLLSQGQTEEVIERAKWLIELDKNRSSSSLLDHALNYLSLGQAYLLKELTSPSLPTQKHVCWLQSGNLYEAAADYMHHAIDRLRKAAAQEFIVHGLLVRTELYRLLGEYTCAWEDLEEAYDIAARGEMRLWLTDYHLGAARVINWQLLADSGQQQAHSFRVIEKGREIELNRGDMVARMKDHVEKADNLINETGYHRRDPEVMLLRAQYYFVCGNEAGATEWLKKAKQRFEEMGIREWDWEIKGLEVLMQDSRDTG